MKYLFLQFCYAVEIGAHLAYVGHYRRSGDPEIRRIANDELRHMVFLKKILALYGKKPLPVFNAAFFLIGNVIQRFCYVSPLFLLDSVARIMEKFALFSYNTASDLFPQHNVGFDDMYAQEAEHEEYFKRKK